MSNKSTNPAAPREFWINANPDNRGWSERKPDQHLIDMTPYGAIHVIEKSHADQLQAKLVIAREALAKQHKWAHDNLTGQQQWDVKYISEEALAKLKGGQGE